MGLPGVGAAPVERRGTEPANDEPRADPTLPKERPTQVVEPADRVETSPKTQAGDPPATEVRPDPPAIRPEVLRRFTSAAADPVRLRSLTSEVEGARTRLATGGIEVDDRAPILGVGATLTRDRSWRDIAATAFAVQPEAVTAGQYTLLAGRNPDLAALIARGGDPAGAIARQGARVTLDHTIEGAQLRATLLEAQAIALAGSREELARGATTDPVNRQAVAQIDQLLMTSADLIAEARVQAGFARLTTQVGEVERRVAGPQPTTGRVPLAEARRELDALISDTNLAPELQRTLARQSVDLTVLEARTIQPLPPSRSVPASTRAAQAVANIHATIERGRAGIDDLVARGVIRAEDAEPLRHRLAFEGAEVRADHHLRRGDFTQAREAYIDQLQLSSGMPRERLDHALRSNERGMYLFSTPPDRAAAPALIETMRGLPEARRNEMIRSMSRIAAAASTNDEDTAARGALRLLDEYASRTQDPVLWGQNRGIAARNAAMRGDLTTAGTELREALRYAVAIPDPSTRQAFVQEVREQYGNVQLQLAAGAGTYDQRRPAADELRRVRMDAENDSGATPDHRARLLLLEAQALAESSQGARARETLERLRGMRSEVAWAGERVDGFLNRHQSDDAGLRVALRELSSETLGEAMVYQGGGMAAGAAVGAAIGVWLGGIGVVPGAAIGALVGGGLGTAALKGRNYVRANRHGAFDGNVIGGISTAGTGETALNGVSLAFDALAIAAPLKATAMLGRAGARALLTPAMADLGRLTPRLEDDVARAFAAAQGRAQSLPPGAQRAAVEGEMRELILRQWTRNAVSIGGTPVAVAGLAAIAAPVAQQLYEIEASNRSSAEK
ncbi:MAG TPA: hypothetical protein VLC93_10965, partial [Myxococcota bacterium]|nr:hypothetical protein [Myxococcota bacterium]